MAKVQLRLSFTWTPGRGGGCILSQRAPTGAPSPQPFRAHRAAALHTRWAGGCPRVPGGSPRIESVAPARVSS